MDYFCCIKAAVVNQSAPNQKDEHFLLSFVFSDLLCNSLLFGTCSVGTGISSFYCLKQIFSRVNIHVGIVCEEARYRKVEQVYKGNVHFIIKQFINKIQMKSYFL